MSFFYYAYLGNKRDEFKDIREIFENNEFDKIVEPFAGSAAVSRCLYKLKGDNIDYIINDIDEKIILFCNNFYKYNLDDLIKPLSDYVDEIHEKNDLSIFKRVYKEKKTFIDNFNYKDDHDENDIFEFITAVLFMEVVRSKHPGIYDFNRRPKFIGIRRNAPILNEFYSKNKMKYMDFKDTLEKYKDDKNAIVFLDPPYFNYNNNLYKSGENKTTELYEYIFDFFENCKCKAILITDKTLVDLVFKKYKYKEYNKTYNAYKNKKQHVIYFKG